MNELEVEVLESVVVVMWVLQESWQLFYMEEVWAEGFSAFEVLANLFFVFLWTDFLMECVEVVVEVVCLVDIH